MMYERQKRTETKKALSMPENVSAVYRNVDNSFKPTVVTYEICTDIYFNQMFIV